MKAKLYKYRTYYKRVLMYDWDYYGECDVENCELETLVEALAKKKILKPNTECGLFKSEEERETIYIISNIKDGGRPLGRVVVPKTITVWRGKTLYVSVFLNYTGQHVCSFLADKLEKTETRLRFSFMEGITPYEDDVNEFDETCVHYATREIPWYEAELERLDRYPEEERDDWWHEAKMEAEDAKRFANSE